jgi:hypothetical protein
MLDGDESGVVFQMPSQLCDGVDSGMGENVYIKRKK